ncbi:MAG: hypothetical protein GY795_21840 [Desulfobacterales bacterium]|nr:hypothetical protein [Desulfobacterales bacterium]
MAIINTTDKKTRNEQPSDTEKCMDACKDKFNQILLHVRKKKIGKPIKWKSQSSDN